MLRSMAIFTLTNKDCMTLTLIALRLAEPFSPRLHLRKKIMIREKEHSEELRILQALSRRVSPSTRVRVRHSSTIRIAIAQLWIWPAQIYAIRRVKRNGGIKKTIKEKARNVGQGVALTRRLRKGETDERDQKRRVLNNRNKKIRRKRRRPPRIVLIHFHACK